MISISYLSEKSSVCMGFTAFWYSNLPCNSIFHTLLGGLLCATHEPPGDSGRRRLGWGLRPISALLPGDTACQPDPTCTESSVFLHPQQVTLQRSNRLGIQPALASLDPEDATYHEHICEPFQVNSRWIAYFLGQLTPRIIASFFFMGISCNNYWHHKKSLTKRRKVLQDRVFHSNK